MAGTFMRTASPIVSTSLKVCGQYAESIRKPFNTKAYCLFRHHIYPVLVLAALATSNNHNGPSRNGDAVTPHEPQWQGPGISQSPALQRPGAAMRNNHQIPHSSTLPTAPTASFYESTNSNEEAPYGQQYRQDGPNRYQANGGPPDHYGGRPGILSSHKDGEKRSAAPLAKPEPLADLEKPAFVSYGSSALWLRQMTAL